MIIAGCQYAHETINHTVDYKFVQFLFGNNVLYDFTIEY